MNWTPNDIIRLSALIGGFLLCGLGGLLMWLGVGADGAVDIKSTVLSGSIKTGSAGLFTLFFGFAVIVFVIASLAAREGGLRLSGAERKSRAATLVRPFWGLLISFLLTASANALGYGAAFGAAAFFLGGMVVFVAIAYVVQLDYE